MAFIVFGFLISLACQKKVGDKTSLLNYCRDSENGVSQIIRFEDLQFEVMYRPVDLLVWQEVEGKKYTQRQIDSVKSNFSTSDYFLLRLSRNGKEIETAYASDQAKFGEVNDYLSFKIGNDIRLVNKTDTLQPIAFIHTRTFGSNLSSDVLVAFKSSLITKSGTARFIFDDNMFESGLHIFDFEISDIKSIPQLNINSTL